MRAMGHDRMTCEDQYRSIHGLTAVLSFLIAFNAIKGNAMEPLSYEKDIRPIFRAHCFDCATDYTTSRPAKVGKFEANGFGVHDTAGNVLEWVQDCYHANYSGAPTDGSVWREGGDCSKRMARGGAYNSPGDSLRAQKRSAYQPSRGRRNIGIRIAREM